jgi:hypothetical protein
MLPAATEGILPCAVSSPNDRAGDNSTWIVFIFLLGGGSKDRQQADIDQAKALWHRQKVKL